MKRWQTLFVGLAISILALYFALRGVDFGKLELVITEGHYLWLIPAAVSCVLLSAVRSLRWKALLNHRIRFNHSFAILNASYLFNSFLPMRLGEVVRAFMTTRLDPPISMVTSLSTVVVERTMDLLNIVLLMIITLIIIPVSPQIVVTARASGILGLVGIGVLILFAVRPSIPRRFVSALIRAVPLLQRLPIETLVERILDGLAPLGHLKTGLPIVGLTLLAWCIATFQIYLLLFVFYDSPTVQATLLIMVLTTAAVALPVVPGNIGPYEAAVVFALGLSMLASPDSAGQTRAFGFAVLYHVVSVVSSAVLGWLGLVQEQVTMMGVFYAVQRQPVKSPGNLASPIAVFEKDDLLSKE